MDALQTIVLGVTGGIAAYKAAELARLLVRGGFTVQVVMTDAATEFVTPLTFQTLTGRPVLRDLFAAADGGSVRHVDLAREADLLVVAPASANTLAKMALGIADNLLTTVYLAASSPVILVPSMNDQMFAHPAVRENLARLEARGCLILEPATGELACGTIGKGRMPEPQQIYEFIRAAVAPKDYKGVTALVTAGPTREYVDPVRFLSNPSTGLMGYAIARALAERGARVKLVSGPTGLPCPAGVSRTLVTTAREMYDAVMGLYADCGLVIKTAAVSDYRPVEVSPQKLKKGAPRLTLELAANPDILKELGRNKGNRILVGFAAETENGLLYARQKLAEKNLDLIVLNDLTAPGAGFAVSTNRVQLIGKDGAAEELPLMKKDELAHRILDRVAAIRGAGDKK
ncbi:MAG: bifunctional phosphopantothenoylcysteine decarboxylase/phosphopantothenate--cysteine ligase CoaBC [Firmicutes bacterium]|nr:bifunctional phosphopantothenoylcysteine decarboxylase/phosphopantothenate--cysteine ligase CoaBC [Bacillota bacterium]